MTPGRCSLGDPTWPVPGPVPIVSRSVAVNHGIPPHLGRAGEPGPGHGQARDGQGQLRRGVRGGQGRGQGQWSLCGVWGQVRQVCGHCQQQH